MSAWLGMSAKPMMPRPALKTQVLARALAARRLPRWGLAAAAGLALAVAAGAVWAGLTARRLTTEVARLEDAVRRYQDTLSLIRSPGSRVIHIPVTTGGRVGAITIFADDGSHRWLVACRNLAPNRPDQAYQLWFITETGMKSAAVMPMDSDHPMVMALEMPKDGGHVMGAAMSIEARGGSAEPKGPMVFHMHL